ncbi:MAG: alpha/beta fold hydrolase, partial [Vicinamibacterales bacterium]
MSGRTQISPELLSLANAIGLIDPDGAVSPEWLSHPLDGLRTILSNGHQRSALFELLGAVVPAVADPTGGTGLWHPLIQGSHGGVFLNVDDELIGLVLSLETPPAQGPGIRASLRVPLLDVSGPEPIAAAGAGPTPIELEVETRWAAGTNPSSLAAFLSVDCSGHGSLRLVLQDLDPAAPPGTRTEIDPTAPDADTARVLAALLAQGLAGAGADDAGAARVAAHLPGVLGLSDDIPPLAVHELSADSFAWRGWLAAIVDDEATLRAWFSHLAGLLGSGSPDGNPVVTGAGTPEVPLRAPLADLDGSALDGSAFDGTSALSLTLSVEDPPGGPRTLLLGLAFDVAATGAQLEGSAQILGIPLSGTAPVRALPSARLVLVTPTTGAIIDDAPAVKVGRAAGGFGWDGSRIVPQLDLYDAVLNGVNYPHLDLTSANAVFAAAAAGLSDAIERAIGTSRAGQAWLALAGLRAPAGDAGWPHALDLGLLVQAPTRAFAALHRAALADDQHGWGHLFTELAAALGMAGPVSGNGSDDEPWRVTIAEEGLAALELAAWNPIDPLAPPGTALLRLGLRIAFASAPWHGSVRVALLSFDLPVSGDATLAFLGSQHLSIGVRPLEPQATIAGVTIAAADLSAEIAWKPGEIPVWAFQTAGLTISGSGDQVGPLTLELSPDSLESSGPDLGLGIGAPAATALLRLLLSEALFSWGGPAAATLGAMAGLHRQLRGLPPDWPLLQPPDPGDVGSLLGDPLGALRTQLERILGGNSSDGTPFVLAAFPWLRALVTGTLPESPATSYPPALPLAGSGTPDRPWALPLVDESIALLGWLEPEGPPAEWWRALAERLRDAREGTAFMHDLDAAAGLLADVDAALHGHDLARSAAGLTLLEAWLRAGDGVVPASAQFPVGDGWSRGTPVNAAHPDLPADTNAVAQIRETLDAWAGGPSPAAGRAVILLAPGFTDHRVWTTYLEAAEPGRSAEAHVDLRAPGIDALHEPLDIVSVVATHYTADLADGSLPFMGAQLQRVVDRVRAITGHSQVYLVGHSTAGLVAWLHAAAAPASVAGVVTLGTPFGASAIAPLNDRETAGALRLADTLLSGSDRTPIGRAVRHLAETIDGVRSHASTLFLGVTGVVDGVRGLAIPGRLAGSLIGDLATVVADRCAAAADTVLTPTHLGFGVRVGLEVGGQDASSLVVEPSIRVDADHFAIGSAVAEPTASAPAVHVSVAVDRTDWEWLVGGPELPAGERLRRVEFAASIVPSASGGAQVLPSVRLYDAGLDPARPWVDLTDLAAGPAPSTPLTLLPSDQPRAAGSAEAFLFDALSALGLLDASGSLTLSIDELIAVATQPSARLAPHLAAVLDVVADAVGASRTAGIWSRQAAAVPLELTIAGPPWAMRLRTFDPATGGDALPLSPDVSVALDAELTFPSFASGTTARLRLASAEVAWTSANDHVTLAAPPWLDAIPLLPAPPAETLRAALTSALPLAAGSAMVSGVLAALAGGQQRVRGIERLMATPGSWFLSPEGLGAADGSGFEPANVGALLQSVAAALGLGGVNAIRLPGALTLAATGSDPLALTLDGAVALGAGGALDLGVRLEVDPSLTVTAAGAGAITLPLTGGTWSALEIGFAADGPGFALFVVPTGGERIDLLPTFSGFGSLAGNAATLLPAVLQAAVDALAPVPGQSTGLLRRALEVARALGLYDFDAAGFEEPARAEELARALAPDWLESKAGNSAAIAQAIAAVFAQPDPPVALPGIVSRTASSVRWECSASGGGVLAATFGWTGTGTDLQPSLTFELQEVDLGTTHVSSLRTGYDRGLVLQLALALEPGGDFAFLRPAIDLALDGPALGLDLCPLGAGTEQALAVRLAPTPGLTSTPDGVSELVEGWGLPLAARIVVSEFEADLDRALWQGGPTARHVVEEAGLVQPGSHPPALDTPLPPPPDLVLRALRALATGAAVDVGPNLSLAVRESAGRVGIQVTGSQELPGGTLGVSVRFGDASWLDDPDAGATLWLLEDPGGSAPLRIAPGLGLTGLGVVLSAGDGSPLIEGSFEVAAAGAHLFLDVELLDGARSPALTTSGLGAAGEILGAAIHVAAADADTFLQKVLPPELSAPFDVSVLWREGSGLQFFGGTTGAGLELTFPLDIDLTIIQIAELFLGLQADGSSATLDAALTGAATLSPLSVVVDRVGLRTEFTPAATTIAFRAPDGLGLVLDAGVVTGGGYLYIDETKGQYAGAIQLQMEGLSLAAIGLLDTRMPDGTPILGPGGLPGFSLLIVITAEFPPIQLGFGFTLNGIGGVLGLDRTIDVPALRAGVRTQALDAMLFPADPIGDAANVVRTLGTIFPVADGGFVVGPMVRLAWGTPTILTLDLGILLEVPDPIRVVVLGRLKVALPSDDTLAVVVINLDAVGVIDFDRGEVSLDAVLYDSLIAGFALTGEMALRARWEEEPSFTLAVGGFHPSFDPPADFPDLARVALSLSSGDNPRLRLEAYLAVTANTIQFGSNLEVYAEAGGFEVDGHLSFDALMQLDPFGLQIDIDGSLSVSYRGNMICSVGVCLSLSGPAPWHALGEVSVGAF